MNKPLKFVLIGQPRTGTTNLVKFLSRATTAYCANELFNPRGVFFADEANDIKSEKKLIARDQNPEQFLVDFYSCADFQSKSALGFNFMLCHNPAVFNYLLEQPDIKIIYIRRENKLAQYASWLKALKNKIWAVAEKDDVSQHKNERVKFTIIGFNNHMQPWITQDLLFQHILNNVSKERIFETTYVKSILSEERQAICKFLNSSILDSSAPSLLKQNDDVILNRFSNLGNVRNYCKVMGLTHWLKAELGGQK